MGRIGRFDYPDISLRTAVQLLARCEKALKVGVDAIGLATALGVSAKTGSFKSRLAALKKYGLISPQPPYRLTELGERVLHPVSEEDRMGAYVEAWQNVPLLRELLRKFGTHVPKLSEFRGVLLSLTGCTRSELDRAAERIFKLYREAVADLTRYKHALEKPAAERPLEQPTAEPASKTVAAPRIPLPTPHQLPEGVKAIVVTESLLLFARTKEDIDYAISVLERLRETAKSGA
ncbi:hypothetical protein DRN94_004105 [archaeon]|nr:hypothetical protein [archaeon]